jgi:hypothetical protein
MIVLCINVAGCDFRREPVVLEYVLPDGFRGVAVVVGHSKGAPSPVIKDGVVLLEFDDQGVCRVPDEGPRAGWYRPHARYRSGQVLPVINDGISEERNAGQVAVWENPALAGR